MKRRNAMSAKAYRLGRAMVWRNTARLYMDCFEQAGGERMAGESMRETVPACVWAQRSSVA